MPRSRRDGIRRRQPDRRTPARRPEAPPVVGATGGRRRPRSLPPRGQRPPPRRSGRDDGRRRVRLSGRRSVGSEASGPTQDPSAWPLMASPLLASSPGAGSSAHLAVAAQVHVVVDLVVLLLADHL